MPPDQRFQQPTPLTRSTRDYILAITSQTRLTPISGGRTGICGWKQTPCRVLTSVARISLSCKMDHSTTSRYGTRATTRFAARCISMLSSGWSTGAMARRLIQCSAGKSLSMSWTRLNRLICRLGRRHRRTPLPSLPHLRLRLRPRPRPLNRLWLQLLRPQSTQLQGLLSDHVRRPRLRAHQLLHPSRPRPPYTTSRKRTYMTSTSRKWFASARMERNSLLGSCPDLATSFVTGYRSMPERK